MFWLYNAVRYTEIIIKFLLNPSEVLRSHNEEGLKDMDIHIKYTNIQSSGAVEEYIHQKIGTLSKLIKDIEKNFTGASDTLHVWVEVAKITRHHQKGKVFYAECQIGLPGKSIRAESTQYDLHVAIDEAKDEMQRMLKKYKEKQMTRIKRGAREVKSRTRFAKGARLRGGTKNI